MLLFYLIYDDYYGFWSDMGTAIEPRIGTEQYGITIEKLQNCKFAGQARGEKVEAYGKMYREGILTLGRRANESGRNYPLHCGTNEAAIPQDHHFRRAGTRRPRSNLYHFL